MVGILDIPWEILEEIFKLVRPDFSELLTLCHVCSSFSSVSENIPINVHIPMSEGMHKVMAFRKFRVGNLCNREPAMFTMHQIGDLNLRRLVTAELVADDYLTKSSFLSPHYISLLRLLTENCQPTLKNLMINADLMQSVFTNTFRIVELVQSFQKLNLLSLKFSPKIEFEQQIRKDCNAQRFLLNITKNMKALRVIYIIHCPAENLILHSDSLEKVCVYRSEFTLIEEIVAPKLRVLMVDRDIFSRTLFKLDVRETRIRKLFEKCPNLQCFNELNFQAFKHKSSSSLMKKD